MYKKVPDFLKIFSHTTFFLLFTIILVLFGMEIINAAGIVSAFWLFLIVETMLNSSDDYFYSKDMWKVK